MSTPEKRLILLKAFDYDLPSAIKFFSKNIETIASIDIANLWRGHYLAGAEFFQLQMTK